MKVIHISNVECGGYVCLKTAIKSMGCQAKEWDNVDYIDSVQKSNGKFWDNMFYKLFKTITLIWFFFKWLLYSNLKLCKVCLFSWKAEGIHSQSGLWNSSSENQANKKNSFTPTPNLKKISIFKFLILRQKKITKS